MLMGFLRIEAEAYAGRAAGVLSVEAKSTAAPGRSVITRSANAVAGLERLLLSLAVPVGLAAAWELAVRAGLSDGRLVPPPSRIFQEFAELCNGNESPLRQSFFEKAKNLFQ